ncbi:hypothetical protein LDENG_00104090 [Lucifuga dentata]|nr:hypothetical protein LDENG_00104090 [Lucifuga dentata]
MSNLTSERATKKSDICENVSEADLCGPASRPRCSTSLLALPSVEERAVSARHPPLDSKTPALGQREALGRLHSGRPPTLEDCLVPHRINQAACLGQVPSASRRLPLPAPALVLVQRAARPPACSAAPAPAPAADSSPSRTMLLVQTSPPRLVILGRAPAAVGCSAQPAQPPTPSAGRPTLCLEAPVSTSTTSNPFGGTSNSLFGGSGFSAAQQPGTTVKFNPPTGSDTMVKAGVTTSINTKHQCITAMKEYENKSLEELRLEDYQAGRKGLSNPMAAATGSLFGTATATPSATTGLFGSTAPNTNFSFGQTKNTFGASTGGFGTTTGGLFGTQNVPQANSLFKPFGQATTAQSTGFSFGNTNTMGQANTSSMGLFGNTAPSQSGGLFGTAQTSAATGFATGTSLFPNTGFGNVASQQNLFGNKTAGFGTTTTSAPSFGLFGNKPALSLGTVTNTSTFGLGANPAGGSLFGSKPATGGLGAGFGAAVGTGQTSLFGNNQNKLGTTLGTMGTFGTTGFNSGTSSLGFGAPQQPVALTDPNAAAAQQAVLQQQLSALAYSPYGDSPLFRNPLSDPKKKEERLKPTNPTAQKALTTPSHYKLTPRPATRVRPKALTSSGTSKSQLFDGLDDDEPSLTNGAFIPRYPSTHRHEYPHNGHGLEEEEEEVREVPGAAGRPDEDPEVMQFYVNPIAKPIPQGRTQASLQDTITDLNIHKPARNGLELSSEDVSASLGEESLQEEREEEQQEAQRSPHPAGQSSVTVT